jgi:hypothetical protein
MPFVRPTVPVSFTVTDTVEELLAVIDVGLAVVEDVNVRAELTVIVPAEVFRFHCWPVALNTPTSTVYVPANVGVSVAV